MESLKHIVKHSAESKSISNQERGLWAENTFIRLLESKKVQILQHRVRMPHGEVDVFACQGSRYFIFEVKYLDNEWRIFERVKLDQIRRLKLNWLYCQKKYGEVSAFIVYVDKNGCCRFVNINE